MTSTTKTKKNYTILGFRLKTELRELYLVEFLRLLSFSLVSLFIPIYIYQNINLTAVFIYTLGGGIFTVLFSILAGKIIATRGLRTGLIIGAIMQIPYFILLYFLESSIWFLIPMILTDAIIRGFVWVTENTDLTLQIRKKDTASKAGFFFVISSAIQIISPPIGAFIITRAGYDWLYLMASIIALLYLISAFLLGETDVRHDFRGLKVLKQSLKKVFIVPRSQFNFSVGYKQVIVGSLWPIFLFITIPNLNSISWLNSLSLIILSILSLKITKIIDRSPKKMHKIVSRGSVVEGISWISKLSVFNFYAILITDAITKISERYIKATLDRLNFGKENKKNNVIEHMVEREVTTAFGFAAMSLLLLILSLFLNDIWTVKIGIFSLGFLSFIYSVSPSKKLS